MSKNREKLQNLIAGVCIVVFVGGLYIWSKITEAEPSSGLSNIDPRVTTTMIAERTRGACPEMPCVTGGRLCVVIVEKK